MSSSQTYGLIGYPVKHSLSPAMHNAAFASLSINAEYKLFELSVHELEPFMLALAKSEIRGINVTVPYKEKVIPYLYIISDEARLIGAVNTIKVTDGRLQGYNTDGEGFIAHLKQEAGFNPREKNIAVLGAGGAAKAIAVCLAKENPSRISLYDIDTKKAQDLASHIIDNVGFSRCQAVDSTAGLQLGAADCLINATPVGMKADDPCLIDKNDLHNELFVYDVIYNPQETRLLALAKSRGCRTSNGLGMLLHQGMLAFQIWTGQKAPLEIMVDALKNALLKPKT